MRRIAVESTLGQVGQMLKQEGYEVTDMKNFHDADCVVVSGEEDNLMGIQDTLTKAPVISAVGKTADQILDEIKRLERS